MTLLDATDESDFVSLLRLEEGRGYALPAERAGHVCGRAALEE
jgi:hypothetical protein